MKELGVYPFVIIPLISASVLEGERLSNIGKDDVSDVKKSGCCSTT
jgi:hypothetical protein